MDPGCAPSHAAVADPRDRQDRGVRWFLLTAFGLSYAGQGAIWAAGGLDGPLFGPVAPLLMFTPAAAAFVACRVEGRRFLRLLRPRSRPVPVLVGILVPAATALTTAFVIAAWLGGDPPPWQPVPGGLAVPDDGPFLWSGTLGPAALVGNVILTAAWLSVLAGLLAVGEEVGWRGYLQPRLRRRFGTLAGLVALGLLWSFWHLPVLLMGYVFPEAPVLGALVLFPLIVVALSIFLGWLRQVTGGIWAAVLAHGSYNAFFGTLVFGMDFGGRTGAAYLVIVVMTVATGLLFVPLVSRSSGTAA